MEKEERILKVTENPQEQLTMLWVMDRIYNTAEAILDRFPALQQEVEEALAPFKPAEDNLPEQIEDLRPAHKTLIRTLENGIGRQTSSIFLSPESLSDFDGIVEKAAQTLKENNVEAVAASEAVDIILGDVGIDEIEVRFRTYIRELVLDVLDENGPEYVDENAEAGLFELVEKGDITKILQLLELTNVELRARQSELGETIVNDIVEIRELISGQYPEPVLTLEEKDEESFETAFDEVLDEELEEEIREASLSLDAIERQLSKLSANEEAVLRIRHGIKKIRKNAELKSSRECSTLSAEDLMTFRVIEQKTRNILSHSLLATAPEEDPPEEPLPNNITPLF